MKILSTFILFTFSISCFAGQFHLFQNGMSGTGLDLSRDVYVYLPDGYENNNQSYKVLYMHDGQNLFDPFRATYGKVWEVEKTLNKLIAQKIIEPIIVVAVDTTSDRIAEYTPEEKGHAYITFIARNLKPLVDAKFRTKLGRENTAMIGSSLGALISLYSGTVLQQQFGTIGAFSPAIWRYNRSIFTVLNQSANLPLKIYIDSGTGEGEKPQDALDLSSFFASKGFVEGENLLTVIEEGAAHDEQAWARRLPLALVFFFPMR